MPNGRGWRGLWRTSRKKNGTRYSRLVRSSSAWWKSDWRFDITRVASAAAPELQAFLLRSEHFSNRHLDDAVGDELAGLPDDALGAAAGPGQFRGTDSFVCAGSIRGRVGGAPGPP